MAGSRESPPSLWKALLAIPLWIRASLWVCLLMLRHIQAHVLHPIAEWWLNTVVGTWEESSKSVIREAFSNTTRFVNGFFSWIYTTFFDRTYRESTKSTYARQTAWEIWWQEPRMSTFNALIRRDQGRHSSDGKPTPTGESSHVTSAQNTPVHAISTVLLVQHATRLVMLGTCTFTACITEGRQNSITVQQSAVCLIMQGLKALQSQLCSRQARA